MRLIVVVTLTAMKRTSPHLNDLRTIFFYHDLRISHGRSMAHGASDATLLVSIRAFYEVLSPLKAIDRFH